MDNNILLLEYPVPGVALLRINRPTVRNALNLALRRELARQFSELGSREEVQAIILTGDEKAFCAGADLNEYVEATPVEIASRNMHLLWGAIANCPKPVIAAVNGYALGGGCELAMHADIIVAGMSAVFGQQHQHPDYGGREVALLDHVQRLGHLGQAAQLALALEGTPRLVRPPHGACPRRAPDRVECDLVAHVANVAPEVDGLLGDLDPKRLGREKRVVSLGIGAGLADPGREFLDALHRRIARRHQCARQALGM